MDQIGPKKLKWNKLEKNRPNGPKQTEMDESGPKWIKLTKNRPNGLQ